MAHIIDDKGNVIEGVLLSAPETLAIPGIITAIKEASPTYVPERDAKLIALQLLQAFVFTHRVAPEPVAPEGYELISKYALAVLRRASDAGEEDGQSEETPDDDDFKPF